VFEAQIWVFATQRLVLYSLFYPVFERANRYSGI